MTDQALTRRASMVGVMRTNRPLRCHLEEGDETKDTIWFHATEPTFAETQIALGAAANDHNFGPMLGLLDKHMLMGETSFADHEVDIAADLPWHIVNRLIGMIILPGRAVASDGKCHRGENA